MLERLRLVESLAGETIKIEAGWRMRMYADRGILEFLQREDTPAVYFRGNTVKSKQLAIGAALINAQMGFDLLPELVAAVSGLAIIKTTNEIIDDVHVVEYTFGKHSDV